MDNYVKFRLGDWIVFMLGIIGGHLIYDLVF